MNLKFQFSEFLELVFIYLFLLCSRNILR